MIYLSASPYPCLSFFYFFPAVEPSDGKVTVSNSNSHKMFPKHSKIVNATVCIMRVFCVILTPAYAGVKGTQLLPRSVCIIPVEIIFSILLIEGYQHELLQVNSLDCRWLVWSYKQHLLPSIITGHDAQYHMADCCLHHQNGYSLCICNIKPLT